MNKEQALREHYKKIHACNKCFNSAGCNINRDSSKVIRKVLKDAIPSEIFIVGQSLAEKTQRLSGMPYTYPTGQLSTTGSKLDRHLSVIGYTIIPNSDRRLVYSSDIVHCYPGKKGSGKGDNKPTTQEIQNCHAWLTEEIEIIKPKVLLLLGKVAAETFYYVYCKRKIENFESLLDKESKMKINNLDLSVFTLPHPASMYPNLSEIYKKTMKLLKL
jgi:uracil-DNA glycosylase family 4